MRKLLVLGLVLSLLMVANVAMARFRMMRSSLKAKMP